MSPTHSNPYAPPQSARDPQHSEFDYVIEETAFGTRRSFVHPDGKTYREFTSHEEWAGMPLYHSTSGICPETGKSKTAYGVFAIGRYAVGIVAIGQVSLGVVAIGQLTLGVLLGVGQLAFGSTAVGQAAVGLYYGLGQFACGYYAVGMFSLGYYARGIFVAGVVPIGKIVYRIAPFW